MNRMQTKPVPIIITSVVLLAAFLAMAQGQAATTVRELPPQAGPASNTFYQGNRTPLLPSALIKLPVGAVRPEGWLRTQIQLMADGFMGHLPEVSHWARFEGSAWASPTGQGQNGWEELPYWLRGY